MKNYLRPLYLIVSLLTALCVSALGPEAYAPASVLSTGRWVKVRVSETGMHLIPASTLRSWGFSDISKVRIHGYGGAMLPDVLDPAAYRDDLPAVASEVTPRGLAFYAVGPVTQSMDAEGTLKHSVNPYSNYGYYFLTEGDADVTPASGGSALDSAEGCGTSVPFMLVHEQELSSPGATGRLMVGEDFNNVRTRKFSFRCTGMLPGSVVELATSFVAWSVSSSSTLSFSVDGEQLPASSADRIATTGDRSGYWGVQALISKTFAPESENFELSLTFNNSGTVRAANLDYLELTYRRELKGSMDFFSDNSQLCASLADGARVWDVTDPVTPRVMLTGASGAWRNDMPGVRHYAIWSPSDNLPVPVRVGSVPNQNLHGSTEVPDMVIVAPDAYMGAARRIAALHTDHATERLKVEVTSLNQVLNEFGSGAFDPGALRRYLKMHYDRGNAAGTPLRYALFIGKGTCDNRALTPVGRSVRNPMPLWVSEASLQENQSFSSDDYFALLDDFDGRRPQSENLDVAVGRIPATTVQEANIAADKIEQYIYSMPVDDWQTRLTILADDENQGQHMKQSETLLSNLARGASGSRMVVNKVYCDAYTRANSTYPDAKKDLFANFDSGTSVFMFIGHGSPTALGSKIIIGPNDFRNQFHLRKLPFFYAATCSFLHWDSDITSMAETLMFQQDGGMIGCISALRPVFITNNGTLSAAFGTTLGEFDDDGRVHTVGELYRRAKNRVNNDANKMRYVLMGDPALRLAIPDARVNLEAVNGRAVSADNPAELKARQRITLSGSVCGTDGALLSDFNGVVIATLYDAEHSVTSHGYGDGEQVTFEQKGDMLFTARGPVTNGRFEVSVQMPAELADNYRPATLSLFAMTDANATVPLQAAGVSRHVYAFGYDDTAELDQTPPVIHSIVLNGDAFVDGQNVNPNPMLIATLSDNSGLNLSSSGVGHRMSVSIDGRESFFDVSGSFTPDPVPATGAVSGTLNYQLSNLADGPHDIRLRVWDMDGNFSDASLSCNVIADLAPEIYEVYTTGGPAVSEAKFYVRHNRPDQMMTVKVTVYNLLGAPLWSGQSSARSAGGISAPVTWNLTTSADGQRVARGIYIYRAEVTTDGSTASTTSRKLSVK